MERNRSVFQIWPHAAREQAPRRIRMGESQMKKFSRDELHETLVHEAAHIGDDCTCALDEERYGPDQPEVQLTTSRKIAVDPGDRFLGDELSNEWSVARILDSGGRAAVVRSLEAIPASTEEIAGLLGTSRPPLPYCQERHELSRTRYYYPTNSGISPATLRRLFPATSPASPAPGHGILGQGVTR